MCFPCVCVSPGLFLPAITLSFFCTNLWQQQQLLRPSLLRPEVETSCFSWFKGACSPSVATAALLLVLLPSFKQCWLIFLFASSNHRNSPWSRVSTRGRITTHKTTIITIKGEHALLCQPRLLTACLWSQILTSIVLLLLFFFLIIIYKSIQLFSGA